jgi:hypothetical protein
LGTSSDEEARSVIQTTDLGFFVAGNVQNLQKAMVPKMSGLPNWIKTEKNFHNLF